MSDALAHVGPWGAYAVAAGLAIKYLSEAWRNRRAGRTEASTATVTDAATANSTLVATLDATERSLKHERADNRAKDERIDQLEARCDELRRQILDQRAEYEEQIRVLQAKVYEVTVQLDELRRRLEAGLPRD